MIESWIQEEKEILEFPVTEHLEPLPGGVQEWLGGLMLLEEVPLRYLVPKDCLLPVESVRFFQLDRNWLDTLADGAFSIGRDTHMDLSMDRASKSALLNKGMGALPGRRIQRMHPSHRRFCIQAGEFSWETPMSGFLMRSELVGHWKGIELRGYERDRLCSILRMETLGDRILLCIFEGIVDKVQMQEPAEALHFGTKDSRRSFRVRAVEGEVGKNTGIEEIIPVRENGRVEVQKLRKKLAEDLKCRPERITSAELTLQLLCVADMCEFKKGGESFG